MTGSTDAARKRPPPGGVGHEVEVLEKDTDTSWALFQALQQQQAEGFEKTRAATVAEAASVQPLPAHAPVATVDDVMQEARRNNRVCPKPAVWQRVYDFLPNKVPALPRVPATRVEWEQLSAVEKRARLRLHIEWAAAQGVLRQVHKALAQMSEDRWHHVGD